MGRKKRNGISAQSANPVGSRKKKTVAQVLEPVVGRKGKKKEEGDGNVFPAGFSTTADVPVPEKLVNQIIGQEKACDIIKKAAEQKRNVLLVGIPGSGKSMLAQAMAELLPLEELQDILIVENKLDENQPKVKVVKAGNGRKIIEAERMRGRMAGGNINVVLLLFLFVSSFFLLFYGRQYFGDVITAAMFIGLFISGAAMVFASQVGRARLLMATSTDGSKLIVDNHGKNKAPFLEGTGAKAGALLGDVRHDPLQCIPAGECVLDAAGNPVQIEQIVEKYFSEGEEGEKILHGFDERVLGGFDRDVKLGSTPVLKVFRRKYVGDLIRIRTRCGSAIRVTPNHPLAVLDACGFIDYVPAGEANLSQRVVVPEKLPKGAGGEKVSPELAVFLADLLADGTLAQRRVEFKFKRDFKIVQVLLDAEALGLAPRKRVYRGATIVSVNSASFCRRLEELGLRPRSKKLVPHPLFQEKPEVISAFLSRLISLDGYVNPQGQFELYSANKLFLQQVRALFLKLGVNPKFYSRKDRGYAKGKVQYVLRWSHFQWAQAYSKYCVNPFHERNLQKYFAETSSGKECFDDLIPLDYGVLEKLRDKTGLSKERVHRDYWSLNPALKNHANLSRAMLQKIVSKLEQTQEKEVTLLKKLALGEYAFDEIVSIAREPFEGYVYNLSTETGNYFVDFVLTHNTGGLGTPAHLRVEAGFVHKANKGVLFIDEFSALTPKSQQELLTAMQEKKYSITGQSEMSSGAMTHTEPVPCDFVLVAAGNYMDVRKMHPALRSRIRGYGYEVYMEEAMDDSLENRRKLVQFVAQEVKKDGKIPHFDKQAVLELIKEARKRAGRKSKLTMKFRDLGGLIRAAGDIAKEENAPVVTLEHVLKAKVVARTLEQQMAQQVIDVRKDYRIFASTGAEVGKVNGLALMGESGVILPIVAEVAPSSSRETGHIIATGKLGEIAKEAVENVSAIIKKHTGKDMSNYDIHIQFLQTYEGVEGDSASISVATAVISALEEVPISQETALTGSLSVRGEVLPVGGITQKIEAAIEAGMKKVIIPKSNEQDVVLDDESKKKIHIVAVKNIYEVLDNALLGKKKSALLSKIKTEFSK
jgi:lon-related putative ATP-dependent protease